MPLEFKQVGRYKGPADTTRRYFLRRNQHPSFNSTLMTFTPLFTSEGVEPQELGPAGSEEQAIAACQAHADQVA